MKKGHLPVILSIFIVACNSNAPQPPGDKAGTDTTTVSAPKPVPVSVSVPRNTGINRSNAYSDLFLDSATVEQFIVRQQINNETAVALRNFYNGRNFQFAWFAGDGLTGEAFAFRTLYDYTKDSTTNRKTLDNTLDELMAADSLQVTESDQNIVKTELLLSWRFINYLDNNFTNTGRRAAALQELVPARKQPVLQLAEELAGDKNNMVLFENTGYDRLREQLKQLLSLEKSGGWPAVPAGKRKYKKGSRAPVIKVIKKRLQVAGMLSNADTSAVFDTAMERGIKAFQSTLGQTPDGIVTPSLVHQMNVPAETRIAQMVINLQRMRWQPAENKERRIQVNIPEFKLHAWEEKTKAFDMAIVVGKEGHSTVMFSGNLDRIVFSPYWNVPESIVRKEILPHLEKNKQYLRENDLEITGHRNGLPVVRQLPGDKNELGKVKFLFPNSFHIYFHDTPHKWLFSRDKRAYSHGCIRLEDAKKMAVWLLGTMPEWTDSRIDSAMNSGKEKTVKLKDPIPVLINYYTAWVDENGVLQFRQDIYRHDERLAAKWFENR